MSRTLPSSPRSADGTPTRLESWKEIAAYLHRDVRTVMRWEGSRGLPVHRLPGSPRAPVFALTREIDEWLLTAPEEGAEPSTRPDAARQPAPVTSSIAVLPFLNLSSDKENEYFADGLADEILTLLTRVPGLRVTARTSSFAFRGYEADVREIGRRLDVAAVLEGSCRKVGDRLRLLVQLVSADDGCHLWADRYDRPLDDALRLQEEIAEGVVAGLRLRLGAGATMPHAGPHAPRSDAYNAYLKGRYFLNRRGPDDLQRALALFERSVASDPLFAPAHLGIANVHSVWGMWGFVPSHVAYPRVKEAASHALALDDSLPAAHLALANACLLGDWDAAGARRHFQRAEELPGTRLGTLGSLVEISFFCLISGRLDDALRFAREALESDPLSAITHTQAGIAQIGLGNIDTAATMFEAALELDAQVPMALSWLGFCRASQGRLEEAVPLLQRAADRGLIVGLAYLANVLPRLGAIERARDAVAQLEALAAGQYVPPIYLGLAYAGFDQRDRCVEYLARSLDDRSPTMTLTLLGKGYLAMFPSWVCEWFDARRRELAPRLGLHHGPPAG
jgi:TolB-like protein